MRLVRSGRQRLGCDEALFARVVKGVFQQRRKMMRNPLRTLLAQLDGSGPARDHSAFLARPELTRRPEQLSVDEFVVKVLGEYDGKKFRNIQDGDLELNSEEEKAAVSEKKEQYKVTKSFNKDGESFQTVMEKILINKLNNL